MEQFRRAAWTEITSNYPPPEEDAGSSNYDNDPPDNNDPPYVDDTYPTEFPFDKADLDALNPGMMDLLSLPMSSAAQLPDLIETVKVENYNASNAPITIFDWNGATITIPPFSTGGGPIVVKRENNVATKVQHNAVMVLGTTVKLTFTASWKGTDNKRRTRETITLFTVEGDK